MATVATAAHGDGGGEKREGGLDADGGAGRVEIGDRRGRGRRGSGGSSGGARLGGLGSDGPWRWIRRGRRWMAMMARRKREGREVATTTREEDGACDEGWRQRLRDLAGAEEEKMGEKRTAAKFGNGDPLGSEEMTIATEVSATEARRGGVGEGDGDGSFSWGRRRMLTVGAVVGKEERRKREAATVVVAARHGGRQWQCWQRQFAATEACWQRTMGEGKKGERRKKGRGRGEKPGGGRRGGCAPRAVRGCVPCAVARARGLARPHFLFFFF